MMSNASGTDAGNHASLLAGRVDVVIFMLLLSVCAGSAGYFPNSAVWEFAVLLVSTVVGMILRSVDGPSHAHTFTASTDFLLYATIPLLLLSQGFVMQKRVFARSLRGSVLVGIFGTSLNVVASGMMLWTVANRWFPGELDGKEPTEALMLAATLVAPDPIEGGYGPGLLGEAMSGLTVGEQLFATPVALSIFTALRRRTQADIAKGMLLPDIGFVMLHFIAIVCVSVGVALVVALLGSALLKHCTPAKSGPSLQLSVLLAMAFVAYCCVEVLDGSGPFALFVFGAVIAQFGFYNCSKSAQITAVHGCSCISRVGRGVVLCYTGMNAAPLWLDVSYAPYGLVGAVLLALMLPRLALLPVFKVALSWCLDGLHFRRGGSLWGGALCVIMRGVTRGPVSLAVGLSLATANAPTLRATVVGTVLLTILLFYILWYVAARCGVTILSHHRLDAAAPGSDPPYKLLVDSDAPTDTTGSDTWRKLQPQWLRHLCGGPPRATTLADTMGGTAANETSRSIENESKVPSASGQASGGPPQLLAYADQDQDDLEFSSEEEERMPILSAPSRVLSINAEEVEIGEGDGDGFSDFSEESGGEVDTHHTSLSPLNDTLRRQIRQAASVHTDNVSSWLP